MNSMNSNGHLSGAKIIMYDDKTDTVLAWFGGTGIHGYDADGNEYSYWQVDSSETNAPASTIRASMRSHIRDGYFPG